MWRKAMRSGLFLALFFFLFFTPLALANAASEPVPQGQDFTIERGLFLLAERALRSGDNRVYLTTREAMAGYPLLQYLEYRYLSRNLRQADPEAVAAFLRDHGDGPLARTLRNNYLDYLGNEKNWAAYLRFAGDPSALTTERNCMYRQALLNTGQRAAALADMQSLWLHGRSQPNACDPIFNAWRAEQGLTPALAWQRFILAIEADQLALARYLRRYLSSTDRTWADRWLELEEDPARVAQVNFNAQAHPDAGLMLERALTRLVPRNLDQALAAWNRQGQRLGLSAEQQHRVQNALGLRLALRGHDQALAFLEAMPAAAFDDTLRQWQLRAGLREGDWQTVLMAASALGSDGDSVAQGQYWRGRALEELGQQEAAQAAYRIAALERNFHGFLAADRLGLPYRIGHAPVSLPAGLLQQKLEQPAMLRMRELVLLERFPEARREWMHIINDFTPVEQEAAARLFADWGWHDRAIFTVARARSWSDISLRFPLAFTDEILPGAEAQQIDPAWAMAVARQESAFLHDVRSSAGALGIMQIMPATGRSIASAAGVTIRNDHDILNPTNNARMGTYYLRRNLDLFGGHALLSTAAYNAGAHRVRSWLPDNGSVDPDIWAELIPFRETRDYVQRVFAYQIIYAVRLGQTPPALSALLYPVTPQTQLAQSRQNHLGRLGIGSSAQLAVNGFCDAPGYTVVECQIP